MIYSVKIVVRIMNKLIGLLVLVFTLSIVVFSTWQLFAGNLEAAFSALPFLVVTLSIRPAG